MTGSIYYIGDPGPDKKEALNIIRQFGIEPHRLGPDQPMPTIDEANPPLALVVCPDVENRRRYITALRERKDLTGIPILARVETGSDEEVSEATHDGADDVLPDGTEWHFTAFLAHLAKIEGWHILRAPQGIALVGEPDRVTRIRIASTLRKTGYDVVFCTEAMELLMSIPASYPRIVVSSYALAREAIDCFHNGVLPLQNTGLAWVVYGDNDDADMTLEPLPGLITKFGIIRNIQNTEQLTFAVNEVLAPEMPEVRLTPRLLYGTTVQFGAESTKPCLRGFTYNINNAGVFVRTLVPFPKGARVIMRLKAPFSSQQLEVIGQVVWVREYSDATGPASPPGMGLQLVDWKEGDRKVYEAGYAKLRASQEKERATIQATVMYSEQPAASTDPASSIQNSVSDPGVPRREIVY